MDPRAVAERLQACRKAARELRAASSGHKNMLLETVAEYLKERELALLKANQEDLAALAQDATPAFRDRLALSPARIDSMVESLRQVVLLPDPVGEEVERRTLENGLLARRVRSPLGVIFMIFESRPNVAVEAFSLAFKSGNVMILRGGKESMRTTAVLYGLIRDALVRHAFSVDSLWGITDPSRELTQHLLQQSQWIDVVVPRGGDRLIEFVVAHSRIPIIKNDRGLCHVYVHEDADLKMARDIVVNAKAQRPGVCNAMETLLVHERVAQALLPELYQTLVSKNLRWHVDAGALAIMKGWAGVSPARAESWDTEYLDYDLNCRVVHSFEEALAHIERHGSRHSEAIVTCSEEIARQFQSEVDAAAVYWNASTRFTDGFELGLGGELGISTQKLHVRGPVGLKELTSVRWVIDGEGQVRK